MPRPPACLPACFAVAAAAGTCFSQGVKIVDADSKRKALKLLRAEAALRAMDVDELMQAAATTRGPGGRKGSGSKKSKGAASTSGAAEVRNDKDAMME